MAVSTPVLCLVLISWPSFFRLVWSSAEGPLEQTAKPGENFTLKCQVVKDVNIKVVEWTRTDLKSPEYVYLQRDGHSDMTYQHPSFQRRVELEDRQMTGGNLDLILKNVTRNDNGTYECRFFSPAGGRINKRTIIKTEPSSIIYLKVEEMKESDANNGRDGTEKSHAPVVVVVCVMVCVCLALFVKIKKHMDNSAMTAVEANI